MNTEEPNKVVSHARTVEDAGEKTLREIISFKAKVMALRHYALTGFIATLGIGLMWGGEEESWWWQKPVGLFSTGSALALGLFPIGYRLCTGTNLFTTLSRMEIESIEPLGIQSGHLR